MADDAEGIRDYCPWCSSSARRAGSRTQFPAHIAGVWKQVFVAVHAPQRRSLPTITLDVDNDGDEHNHRKCFLLLRVVSVQPGGMRDAFSFTIIDDPSIASLDS